MHLRSTELMLAFEANMDFSLELLELLCEQGWDWGEGPSSWNSIGCSGINQILLYRQERVSGFSQ